MKRSNEVFRVHKRKIGSNIRKWRNIKGMKQKDLAAAMQLSEGAISNIENDLTDITLSQLDELSASLDIGIEQLFCDPQETYVTQTKTSSLSSEQLLAEKDLLAAMLNSMQKKDEQLQALMQNVLHTMSALIQDEKKFA